MSALGPVGMVLVGPAGAGIGIPGSESTRFCRRTGFSGALSDGRFIPRFGFTGLRSFMGRISATGLKNFTGHTDMAMERRAAVSAGDVEYRYESVEPKRLESCLLAS